jgi:hypothetical protein
MLPELFRTVEQDLQRKIRQGTAPFLSLFDEEIPPQTRTALKKFFVSHSPTVNEIEYGFSLWPALMSSHLTAELNAGLSAHFSIYPHIEKAFGITLTSDGCRRRLWQAFRKACAFLDLEISPRLSGSHFMVTEYLRQMGVPLAYAGYLAERIVLLGARMGYPDADDPTSLRLWQEELLRILDLPFPKTARQAIALDHQAYYIRLFLDILDKDEAVKNMNFFQQRMAQALTEEHRQKRNINQRLGIPRVVCQDGTIGALLPIGTQQDWSIEVNGEVVFSGSCGDDAFVPFDEHLPSNVTISCDSPRASWEYALWPDTKDNRMLLFGDRDCRLQHQLEFGKEHVPISPGAYVLLSRFDPDLEDLTTQQVCDSPDIFATTLNFAPAEIREIRRGPAVLQLVADAMPLLQFQGDRCQDQEGQELFAGQGLKLLVILPDDLVDEAVVIRLRSRSLGEAQEVLLKKSMTPVRELDLNSCLSCWKPGVTLLTVECRRSDANRLLASAAALVWNGLDRVKRGAFFCSRAPENLHTLRSENFQKSQCEGEAVCRYTINDPANRLWRLVFNDGRREVLCTWSRPGLHMRLRSYGGGRASERTLREGSQVSINTGLQEVLLVFGLGEGCLCLGDSTWNIDGDQHFWRAPLASLCDAVTQNSSALIYESRDGITHRKLLYFVTPHHCNDFHVTTHEEQLVLSFRLLTSPQAVVFRATNLCTGTLSRLYAEAAHDLDIQETFSRGGIVIAHMADTYCRLQVEPTAWSDGLWLLEADVQCEGRWGRLSNSRQDNFSCLMPVNDGLFIRADIFRSLVQSLSPESKAELLRNLHKILLRCYAPEAWENMAWLADLWRDLLAYVENSANTFDTCRLALLETLGQCLEDDSPLGWTPLLYSIADHPSILTWKCFMYSECKNESSHFSQCISLLPDLAKPQQIFNSGDYSPALFMGFGQKQPLKNFSLKRSLEAWPYLDIEESRRHLQEDNWMPGRGDYLGPLHYRYVLGAFLNAQTRAENRGGNPRRRSWATLLARRAQNVRILPTTHYGATVNDWDKFFLYGIDVLQNRDTVVGGVCFLASFAYLCRSTAHGGLGINISLEDYLNKLKHATLSYEEITMAVEYILVTGQELIGFYLLFWELLFQLSHRRYIR